MAAQSARTVLLSARMDCWKEEASRLETEAEPVFFIRSYLLAVKSSYGSRSIFLRLQELKFEFRA
jgi:hypothetical protein